MKLEGQVAIITGAGRNIGEEMSKLFAAEGAKVAVIDMDQGRADAVAAEIGDDAMAVVTDISDSAQVKDMVAAVVGRWGRIDILVNNVAISDNKTILDITEAEWNKVMAVTLTGPFLMSKYVAEQMVSQGEGGKIVNVASTSGWRGRPRAIAYTTAKGGVINFTRSLAVQLAPHNIRVNSISPNKIGSPVGREDFNPDRPIANLKGRAGHPIEAAQAVLFLVSDESEFIVGENLFVDGGTMAMETT
ncbi:MAG: SDR family oxidoreductase [Alphaproteobacteria bacterium]